jgi:hypothetical protein
MSNYHGYSLDPRRPRIYGGVPLMHLKLTMTEDSDDDSSVPYDEVSTSRHDPFFPREPFADVPWFQTDEDSTDELSIPFDETPSPTALQYAQTIEVCFCHSETCDPCRRPRYPIFLPAEPVDPQRIRAFAGTRWWDEEYDDDILLTQCMNCLFSFFEQINCTSTMTTHTESPLLLKKNVVRNRSQSTTNEAFSAEGTTVRFRNSKNEMSNF